MPTFALFGDSYIKRLRFYCNGDLQVPGNVFFYDRGGLRTDHLSDPKIKPILQRCVRRQADVYFINIGGNDIKTKSEPELIFERIIHLVDQLYSRPRVKLVYIGEIQTRGELRGDLPKDEFDRQRKIINDLLQERNDWLLVEFKDVLTLATTTKTWCI